MVRGRHRIWHRVCLPHMLHNIGGYSKGATEATERKLLRGGYSEEARAEGTM